MTGAQLIGRAVSAAEFLLGLPTPAGVPVPALVTGNADAIALLMAGAITDRPLAPIGTRLTTDELAKIVEQAGSTVVLAEPAHAAVATAIAARTCTRGITIPAFAVSKDPLPTFAHNAAFVLHTAGTTGNPKPVPITDAVIRDRSRMLQQLIGFSTSTIFATGSPIHHVGGIGNLLAALTAGGAATATQRFTATWWSGLARIGVTHVLLVPTMIEMLLSWGVLDKTALTTLIYGAAPIRPQTVGRILNLLPSTDLVQLFGQTEGSPITCLQADDHRRALAQPDLLETVGRAVPGLQLRIASSQHSAVGEVLAAAPHLAGTASDGWLYTGDVGEIDADGYLRLRGRLDDRIIRGGENVYPTEVENIIAGHPEVGSVGVVGVPETRLGETIAAFIVPTDREQPPSQDELHTWSRRRMAGFKVPAHWHIVDELPLNAAGKLLRRDLRRLHLEKN